MDSKKSYYKKIKKFILYITLIPQIFLCAVFSYSYLNYRYEETARISQTQRDYYKNSIFAISTKINNMLHLFEESGAISFCSQNYTFKPDSEVNQTYSKMINHLNYSELTQRYIHSFYLLSGNDYNYSISKTDGVLSKPGDFTLNTYYLMNFDRPNGFNTNYQKFYRFNKEMLCNMNSNILNEKSYTTFINDLDGKFVYYTFRKDVLCVFVFNDDIFTNIFSSADQTNTSVVIKNKSDEVLFCNDKINCSKDEFSEKNELFSLYIDNCNVLSVTDIVFLMSMLLICGIITFIMILYSDSYALKIMEPYRIINTFFRLNTDTAEFDLSDYSLSTKKRLTITRTFFKTYLCTILIPTIVSLLVFTTAMHISTRHFEKEYVAIYHDQLVSEFYNNFDSFIASNVSKTQNTHFDYTVLLDSEHNIVSHPLNSVSYNNVHLFTKSLKPLAGTIKTGTLVHIPNDLLGETAIGIFKNISTESIQLNVIKNERFDKVYNYKTVNFILSDSTGNIIAQSPYNAITTSECNNKASSNFLNKYTFDEYDWTLYTFLNKDVHNHQINNIPLLTLLIMLFFLFGLSIVVWRSSIFFTHPFEHIISSLSEYNPNKHDEQDRLFYSNEIEELISTYNEMLGRIKKISEEKLAILAEKEKLNAIRIQAEFDALQHQINPHFLYNTLQAISLNVSSYNTSEIMKITASLSDIYRYAANNSLSVYLSDEFENLRNYIYIWDTLFPNRFTIEYDLDPNVEIISSPKLILQPVVENCFLYAFKHKTENCHLKISAKILEDTVVIVISDNGCGMDSDMLSSLMEKISIPYDSTNKKGLGIKNVYQRLKIYYNDHFSFNITSTPGCGTSVTLKFSTYSEYFGI